MRDFFSTAALSLLVTHQLARLHGHVLRLCACECQRVSWRCTLSSQQCFRMVCSPFGENQPLEIAHLLQALLICGPTLIKKTPLLLVCLMPVLRTICVCTHVDVDTVITPEASDAAQRSIAALAL